MTPPVVKICGITNVSDAMAAIQAGADWLGFIFVPDTPRFITVETAQAILQAVRSQSPPTQCVGVFQNASAETIQAHWAALGLDQIQLHGDETPAFCEQLPAPVIKTLLLQPHLSFSNLSTTAMAYLQANNVKTLLLDLPKNSAVKAVGSLPDAVGLRSFLSTFPSLLAGGVTADNLQSVLEQFQPVGVDVASGVEQAPGQKDVEKMNRFCQIIQNFKSQPNHGDPLSCNP
ncbi:N-(5'-phosphoribosyl)anthranilate isomerase [Vampirovibrio sp.]|uniref:phosphoribosylanthranilate isomerase n=1 Tax=Vampirovibrio sp. TaxID=2717857 RepID=UPI003592E906